MSMPVWIGEDLRGDVGQRAVAAVASGELARLGLRLCDEIRTDLVPELAGTTSTRGCADTIATGSKSRATS